MRRKTYVVQTYYTSTKTYELLANDADHARKLIGEGYRAGLINIDETFNVSKIYRKERKQ